MVVTIERSISKALHISRGIWARIEDEVDDAHPVFKWWKELVIFCITRIVDIPQFDSFCFKLWRAKSHRRLHNVRASRRLSLRTQLDR